jgi:hypothetical protein
MAAFCRLRWQLCEDGDGYGRREGEGSECDENFHGLFEVCGFGCERDIIALSGRRGREFANRLGEQDEAAWLDGAQSDRLRGAG